MAQLLRFDGAIPGIRPSDCNGSAYQDWMRELLFETANSLLWRKQRGTITSPELSVLSEIQAFWPERFFDLDKDGGAIIPAGEDSNHAKG